MLIRGIARIAHRWARG